MSVYHKHLVLSHYITAMVHYLQQQDMLPFVIAPRLSSCLFEKLLRKQHLTEKRNTARGHQCGPGNEASVKHWVLVKCKLILVNNIVEHVRNFSESRNHFHCEYYSD